MDQLTFGLAIFAVAIVVIGVAAFFQAQSGGGESAFFGDETERLDVSPAQSRRNLRWNAIAFGVMFAIALAVPYFAQTR